MINKLKNKIAHKIGNDANLKELLSGSAVTFVIKVAGMGIGYLVILVISRKYGADGVGVYGLTSRILNSLAILGAMGMNVSVLRYVGQFANKKNSPSWLRILYGHIMKFVFPFSIVVGITLFFLARTIAVQLLDNPIYTIALKISAIALPLFTINLVNVEFIRGLKLLKISEYLRSINRQITVLILLILSVFSFGLLDPVYAFVSGLLLTFVFSMGYILIYFNKNKPIKNDKPNLTKREVVSTSLPMMATTVSSFLLANVGVLFIETYTTTDQVGIYNVCLQLAMLVAVVLTIVNTISAPKFAELFWAKRTRDLQRVIQQATKLIFWASLGISLFLLVFSKWILGFFGSEFTTGSTALFFLVIGQMINGTTGSTGIFLNMSGNQKVLRNIIVIATIIILLSYYFVVPIYGIVGASIVSMIGSILVNVPSVIYIYKKLGIITFYIPLIKKLK